MPNGYSDTMERTGQQQDRFPGEGAVVVTGGSFGAGSGIEARWAEAGFDNGAQPEEGAKLYYQTQETGKHSLQLCYIVYNTAKKNYLIYSFHFLPVFFEQYADDNLLSALPFRAGQATEQDFTICARSMQLLKELGENESIIVISAALKYNHCATGLLGRALEHVSMPFSACQVPACRFLAFESERAKIEDARVILQQNTDRPHTIKELSRKVGMNECYLKKGFKALIGKTIHEYQQELRIERAKELLQQKGYSVTEAAAVLGYSSISHFSTAFKRSTGIKPCELLK